MIEFFGIPSIIEFEKSHYDEGFFSGISTAFFHY